jgi:hypothetical protein
VSKSHNFDLSSEEEIHHGAMVDKGRDNEEKR